MNSFITTGSFLLSIFGTPVYASDMPLIEAPVPLNSTIEQKIENVSLKYGVNPATSTDIAFYESSFDPDNTNGIDSGIYQFNDTTFQEKCIDKYKFAQNLSQKNDPDIQIECAIHLIADGQYWRWASSRDKWDRDYAGNNCVSYVKSKGIKLPRIIDAGNLDANSKIPIKGGVVILSYKVHHLAYIESIQKDGIHISEGNYRKGQITERILKFDDEHIIGFWRQEN